MSYEIFIEESALEDLKALPRNFRDSITRKIYAMKNGLPGSVKALRGLDYSHRLRLGDYRILFDLKGEEITVHRVLNRRHAYASQSGKKKRKGQH